jgi:molecular chaperone HscC
MIVGIDLGTTHSLVGVWRDGGATLIPNALGHLLTPSAVGVGDDGAILVGLAARERLSTHPKPTATACKRWMGTDRLLLAGQKGYRPEELSALVCGRSRRKTVAMARWKLWLIAALSIVAATMLAILLALQ